MTMDEAELFKTYARSHDLELRNQIVERYLYIAEMLAKKFVGRGVEYDDLYQVASLALIKGVERFDVSLGIKFSTFITPTITGEIKNYFRDRSRLVHLPRRVNELKLNIRKAAEELAAKTGKQPTAREIAAQLGLSEEEVVRVAEAGAVVSLDSPSSESERGGDFHEIVAAEDDGALEALERRDILESAMKDLRPGERSVIEYRYMEGLSQTETAQKLGVSQMYVSRLERKVLEKLRKTLGKVMSE